MWHWNFNLTSCIKYTNSKMLPWPKSYFLHILIILNSRLLINIKEPTQASKMQYVLISNKVEKLHDKDPTYIQFPEPTQA